jgi:phosphonate transport system substrate-binding protein
MIELLRAGEVDIVRATAFTALTLEDEAGAEIFLREWRKGVAFYHTVFFTRKENPIRSLSDLAGKTIAFEDPGSTSAYFVPMLTLRCEGLSLVDLSAAGAAKSDDAVNFVFAESEVNIVGWVVRGRADAGVLSNLEWVDPEKAPASLRHNLRIFHKTPPVLRSVLLVRDGLSPALKARLKDLLVTMHESDEGRAALAAVKAARYDEIIGEAAADLEHVRNLYTEFR